MFELAEFVGSWSKDRSTKVGAVIARGKRIASVGYNGFPSGVNDNIAARHDRPDKYFFTEHAERNAIFTAGRSNTSIEGCTIYVPNFFPCADCSRAIIASGIGRVVTKDPSRCDPEFLARWGDSIAASLTMFGEAGVQVIYFDQRKN